MRLFKIICNWTPKIWFPLAIVLLNGVINFLANQHLIAYLDLDLFTISPIIVGFFAIAGALINWILISVLLFFACRLFYKGEGVFRNFFKIIGLCYLVLLVATLSHSIVILIGLPPNPTRLELTTLPRDLTTLEYNNTTDSQARSEAITEALASFELPVQLINIAGQICFALTLVVVVQTFFEIRWLQAFFITGISYAIYWILNQAFWFIFPHIFLFFFPDFFGPSWQPGDPIRP
ncbi:MAG: hypothetical protein OXU51_06580 [Candidatus Poribacteria bacterium]|nr:hypothetical protein [Candidatus Poribacteria bacterium]